jgi:hypothetical protein
MKAFVYPIVFLTVVAVIMHYAKWPILTGAALVGFFAGYVWLCGLIARVMIILTGPHVA